MKLRHKRLRDQVIVLTGATSGIGLVTARLAAGEGAHLVLVSRNEQSLRTLADEINASHPGHATYVVADVGNPHDVDRVAATAVELFGSFDTWVNNAGVSIYGRLVEVELEDERRLFETNFWGVVHGSLAAVRHLHDRKQHAAALVNIGSTLSDRAIPLQGMYCASKHAVKGFTDALRMELEEEGAPISVTLIKPAAIDTPYIQHAKNYLPNEPLNPPPVYAPELVAHAILHCAQHPVRDLFVGAGGKAVSAMGQYAPRLTDKAMEATMFKMQQRDEPARPPDSDSLHESRNGLNERGGYRGHVAETSVYTAATMHPVLAGAFLLGVGAAAVGAIVSAARPTRPFSKARDAGSSLLAWLKQPPVRRSAIRERRAPKVA